MNEHQRNGIERVTLEFAEACASNPELNQAAQDLRESVSAAAEEAGVDPSKAFGIIIRDMMMLEFLQKRVEEARSGISSGNLPVFIIEEASIQR